MTSFSKPLLSAALLFASVSVGAVEVDGGSALMKTEVSVKVDADDAGSALATASDAGAATNTGAEISVGAASTATDAGSALNAETATTATIATDVGATPPPETATTAQDAGTSVNAGVAPANAAPPATANPSPTAPDFIEGMDNPLTAPIRKGFGAIRGTVVDEKSGEALIDASVKVLTGGKGSTTTDVDGRFSLELKPGTYDLRAFYELYEPRRISSVQVTAGEVTSLEIALGPTENVTEQVIVVEARADTRSEGALLQARREAVTVQDAVSAEEISRTPDANASDAVKRVVSATIIDGKYVLLRGLGGRYVTTMLNGVVLPSPDPDTNAVPLDLFPTSLLANLTVLKSYDAEYPATFGGGALLIETNAYPSSFEFKPRLSLSGDSVSTFRMRNTYAGGGMDWLGFDDGSRALPSIVPTDGPVPHGRDELTRPQVEAIGESFSNTWAVSTRRAMPNASLGATIGDTLSKDGVKLGYLGTLSYGHKESIRSSEIGKGLVEANGVGVKERVDGVVGTQSANLGALLNTGLQLSNDTELELFALYTHTGENLAQRVTGSSESDGQEADITRLQFVERSLAFAQLGGFHRVLKNSLGSNGLELRWKTNLSGTTRLEPDTRDTRYNVRANGQAVYQNEPGSGERFFSTLNDRSYGALLDGKLPFERLTLRGGGSAQRTTRNFSARRFRYNFVGEDTRIKDLPPEQLFSPEHIGDGLRLQERTLSTDGYTSFRDVFAGFAAADWNVIDPLRLSAGVRYEVAHQQLTPGTPFSITGLPPPGVDRTDGRILPTASASYALTDASALRASYSFTVARPEFRELAPFLFFDFTRRRSVSGNPDLEETRIHNADLRYEFFPSSEEVLAASAFAKQFIAPIEQVIVSASTGDVGYENAEGATALGVELEGRVNLGRLAAALNPFRLAANLTLIRSEVNLTPEQLGSQTNSQRPLQGQSPYVANLSLLWSPLKSTEVSALYNVQGPRIAEVGFQGLPDVYEQAFHRVDLTLSHKLDNGLKLKASGVNLLNQAVVLEQGGVTILRYRPGIAASLSAELSY